MKSRGQQLVPTYLFKCFFAVGFVACTTLAALSVTSTAFASWSGQPYVAGQTLNPECAPTDNLCTVATSTIPWVVDTNTGSISYGGGQVVAPSFSATSTNVASVLQGLTFTNATGSSASLDIASIGAASTSQLFSTGTTTFATLSGAVGIGTNNPGALLDIQATAASRAHHIGAGTITVSTVWSTTSFVSGTDTHFLTDVRVGDTIFFGDGEAYHGVVSEVINDTFLVLIEPTRATVTNSTYSYKHPTFTVGDPTGNGNAFVVYGDSGSQMLGTGNTVLGTSSTAIGSYNIVTGTSGIALGTNLIASSTGGIVIGSGAEFGGPLVNNVDNSLQVGFNSDKATLFVGTAYGAGFTGVVGIGTTSPSATLGVSGTVSIADDGIYFNPNLKNNGTLGLYAEWWNSQTDNHSPDYSLPANVKAVADPSVDLYANRPGGVSAGNINARISGWIKADYTEQYEFCSASDDGSNVWVNGQIVVSNWFDQGQTERCGSISLVAGTWYPYRVEFYQGGGPAALILSWSSPSLEKQSIPMDHTVNSGAFIDSITPSSSAFTINASSTTQKFVSLINSSGSEVVAFSTTSSYFNTKLGVGTSTPSATLEIAGPGAGSFAGGYPSLVNIHTPDSNPWGITFQNDSAGSYKESGMYLDNGGIFYIGSTAYASGALGVSQAGNVSIGSYTAARNALSVTGGETSVTLTRLSSTEVSSPAQHVEVVGTTAFLAAGNFLQILDVTDPNLPAYLGSYDFSIPVKTVRVVGTTAYVAAANTVYILDVSNPAVTPTLLGSFTTGTTVQDLRVSGNYAYVVDAGSSFYVFNIADSGNPYIYTDGSIETAFSTGVIARIVIGGGYAYIVEDQGLEIMSISDPANPSHVSSYNPNGGFYGDVALSGGYLYLTKDVSGSSGSFVSLDVSDHKNPVEIGSANIGNLRINTNIVIKDNRAYVSDGNPDSLYVISVATPNSPTVLGHIATNGFAYGVAVDGRNNVYVVDSTGSFYAFSTKFVKTSASFMNGNVGIGTITPSAALSIVGTNTEVATDGSELTTNGVFDGSSSWNFGSDWSYDMSGGMVHTPNNSVTTLNQGVPSVINGQHYVISFVITDRTKGNVQVGLSASANGPVFSGNNNNGYITEVVEAGNGGYIEFLPSTDFDGVIRNVSIKHISQTDATVILHNSDNSLGSEIRTGSNEGTLNSVFLGVDSGAFNFGYNVVAGGSGAAKYNVGSNVSAFGHSAAQQNTGGDVAALGTTAAGQNTGYTVNAIGLNAALQNSGNNVNAIGAYSAAINSGSYVDAIGARALYGKTGGSGVVAVGSDSTQNGWFHGTQTAISNSILLGASTHTALDSNSSTTVDNVIAIGGRATQSNQVVIGNGSTTQTLLYGNVGIGTTIPLAPLAVDGPHTISFLKQGSFSFTGNYFTDIYAATSTIYALNQHSGLFIFDTKNPANPKVKGVIEIGGSPTKVVAEGNFVYVAKQNYILAYDISDPANPILVDLYDSQSNGINGPVTSLAVKNGLVYASNNSEFSILDYSAVSVSHEVDPTFLGSKNVGYYIQSIAVDNNSTAYLSTQNGLYIENVSGITSGSPGTPSDLGSYTSASTVFEDTVVSGHYAYSIGMDMVVRAFDISDLTKPKLVDAVQLDVRYQDQQHIRVMEDYVYVSDGTPDSIYALYVADPANMTLAGHIATHDEAMGLAVYDGILYVAEGNGGGEIFSVSTPQTTIAAFMNGNVGVGTIDAQARLHVEGRGGADGLKFLSSYKTAGVGLGDITAKDGNYLYAQSSPNGFDIIDATDPNNTKWAATWYWMGELANGPAVFGGRAYVSDIYGNLLIVDVSNPRSPQFIGSYSNGSVLSHLVAANSYFLYGINESGAIEILNVSNPEDVQVVIQYSSENPGATAFVSLDAAGQYLYAMDNHSGDVEILDSSNPLSLSKVGVYSGNVGYPAKLAVAGNYMYLNVLGYRNKLEIVDISNPAAPTFVSEYNSPTTWLGALAAKRGFVFEKNNAGNIEVIDVSNPVKAKYVTDFTAANGSFGTPFVSGDYLYSVDSAGKLETIDASNPKPSVAAVFTGGRVGVGTTNPNAAFSVVGTGGDGMSRRGAYTTPFSRLTDTVVSVGTTTFALDSSDRLEAIDTTDPTNPKLISAFLSATSTLSNLFVSGDKAFFTDASGQIDIVDVSNPADMVYKNTLLASSMPAYGFTVRDGLLYVVDDNGDLEIWNVVDPLNLSLVNTFHDGSALLTASQPISLAGNTIYAKNNNGNISVIDISSPFSVSKITEITPNAGSVSSFGVLDNTLFISDYGMNTLEFFNISDPSSPSYVSTFTSASFASGTFYSRVSSGVNGYLYVTDGCALRVLDISNPASPKEVDSYEPNVIDECYAPPFVGGGRAYTLTESSQMVIFDISGVAHPSLAATFADGRVGVGTENPLALFDVSGNMILSGMNRYLNFDGTSGLSGYGFRDDHGTLQFKNYGGEWTNFGTGSGSVATTTWEINGTSLYYATTTTQVGIGTSSPQATLDIDSGSDGVSGLRFSRLNSGSTASTTATGILGIDASGNVVISPVTSPLTSQVLAYWDGLNDPTVASQAFPQAELTGDATFVPGSGVRLTDALNSQSGSINWSFTQLPFERTQFNFKASDGNGADSTWFYSYSDSVPTDELGDGMTKGYIIYFSEYHGCAGISYGPYGDGGQCGSGGVDGQALASASLGNIGDGLWHNVDISTIYNRIIVRWDGAVIIDYTDVYGRDLTGLKFGFGSRTGALNNAHYIKGLVVSKLGTNISEYGIASTTPIVDGLYWDAQNKRLGIGDSAPTDALTVSGSIYATGDICSSAICLSDLSPSDQRFKKNIVSLSAFTSTTSTSTTQATTTEDILSNIMKLNPVSYNWNDTYLKLNPGTLDATSTKIGFIAQEMQTVFPEVVGHTSNGFLGIDYSKLTSVLTAGVQEIVSVGGAFKTNLVAWFGSVQNSIGSFFAGEVHTKKICVAKTDGTEVCITGDDLQKISPSLSASVINVPSVPVASVAPVSSVATTTTTVGDTATIATTTASSTEVVPITTITPPVEPELQATTSTPTITDATTTSGVEYQQGSSATPSQSIDAIAATTTTP